MTEPMWVTVSFPWKGNQMDLRTLNDLELAQLLKRALAAVGIEAELWEDQKVRVDEVSP